MVAGSTYYLLGIGDSDAKKSGDHTPFAVSTDAFAFDLPQTPKVEPLAIPLGGATITGTGWVIDSDINLTVTALDFGAPLDEAAVQGGFDNSTAGVIERSNGTLVSDDWSTVDGVYERITVSTYDGGYIFQHGFAKGNWFVTFLASGSDADPPQWFTDVVASFSFV